MRSTLLLLPLALVACDRGTPEQATRAAVQQAEHDAAADSDAVACARAGEAELKRACLVERTDSPNGLILTLRHPDGSFRRLLVTRDGRGVVAADGAEPARVTVLDRNRIAVAVGGDRYELPATVKPGR